MNPFPYQRPVRPEQVIDRDSEVGQLMEWCHSGMLVRLDGPRRYGKTSLVRRLYAEAAKQGTAGIMVDMKGVLTLGNMVTRLGNAYLELRGPIRRKLEPILKGIEGQFNVQVLGSGGGAGLKLPARDANEEGALLALLKLPVEYADRTGWKQVIVCFDEFQDVLSVPSADDKMRGVIQHQPETVSYIFTGSEPRLMNTLFGDRQHAFWSQAEPLSLEPLAAQDTSLYIADRFAETKRDVGEALGPLLSFAAGHPQRTMLLANKVWTKTGAKGTASLEVWEAALAAARLQTEPECEAVWRALTTVQQRVLRALVVNGGYPYRKPGMAAAGITRGSVEAAVEALVAMTVLHQIDAGRFVFVDPMFGTYVADLAGSGTPDLAEDADEE